MKKWLIILIGVIILSLILINLDEIKAIFKSEKEVVADNRTIFNEKMHQIEHAYINNDYLVYDFGDYDRSEKKSINTVYVYDLNGKLKKEIKDIKYYNKILFLTDDNKIACSVYDEDNNTMDLVYYDLDNNSYEEVLSSKLLFSFAYLRKGDVYIDTKSDWPTIDNDSEKGILKIDKNGKESVFFDYTKKNYKVIDIHNNHILYENLTDLNSIKYYVYNASNKSHDEVLLKNEEGKSYFAKGFYNSANVLIGTVREISKEEESSYKIFTYDISNKKMEIIYDGILLTYNEEIIIYRDSKINTKFYKTTVK